MFCLDVWKQLLTAGFAHIINVFLSVYVTEITHMGNGCSWYLIQLTMDLTVGIALNYALFKIVDNIAITFGIEVSITESAPNLHFVQVLKSGVYTDVDVSLIDDDVNPDDLVDYKIWLI